MDHLELGLLEESVCQSLRGSDFSHGERAKTSPAGKDVLHDGEAGRKRELCSTRSIRRQGFDGDVKGVEEKVKGLGTEGETALLDPEEKGGEAEASSGRFGGGWRDSIHGESVQLLVHTGRGR